MKSSELQEYMNYFTGTEHYYRVPWGFVITDGVKGFIEKAEAVWMLNIVGSVYLYKRENFNDIVTVDLNIKNGKGDIVLKVGKRVFHKQHLAHTDCPDGEWRFFMIDGVFLWNREY